MQNDLKIFEFENKTVECIFLDDEPLFNPYDVGICLGIKETTVRDHLAEMDDEERILLKNSDVVNLAIRTFNNRGEVFLKEPGLYHLIFESRKPEAKKFKKWVVTEVLPTIRKTGSYHLSKEDQILQQVINNAENLLGIRKREIAINQNESWNMKLAKLIWDCSTNKMGSVKDLYNEVVYLFAAESGINVNELAESQNMTRREYLLKNKTVCKTIYEFAIEHFYKNSRQVMLIPFDKDQTMLTKFK